MEGLTWGAVVAVVALCCSLCSIAAFLLGRRKAAQDEGKEEGSLKTDIQYIKDTIRDTTKSSRKKTKSLENLSLKLDTQDKQREEDYRQLLIQITELKSSYKSLHIRVDEMNKRIDEHYHQ